uniref:Palm2 and akap2 fusion n=1 Tax=Oncorhynchus mykiss TaxID=8022 RepID=A0A8C7S7Y9_ONCMY
MLCGSFVGKEAMVKQVLLEVLKQSLNSPPHSPFLSSLPTMRERWLLQGTTPGTNDEDDGRRQQLEKDEEQGKRLEDSIDRLESEIGLLESEECQISAKEQTLRERLRKTESVVLDGYHGYSNTFMINTMYAMEINVEKDRKTGDTRILSASAVSPDEVPDCGVKVFDDGRNVVYEVRSGGSSTLDNGVHHWSSQQVDELMKRVGATTGSAPQATAEKPITMIFMGNHNVDDQDETKRLLGFDGTIKAEIVLIDEDDEKSLREKTVTDGYSTMDGNAADLVSGSRPLSDTTELSSEGKDESSATATKELPSPAGIEKKERCHCCTIM